MRAPPAKFLADSWIVVGERLRRAQEYFFKVNLTTPVPASITVPSAPKGERKAAVCVFFEFSVWGGGRKLACMKSIVWPGVVTWTGGRRDAPAASGEAPRTPIEISSQKG